MAVKKFVKFDSEKGYLDNKDDINYYIATLMRKVAFGNMLGDFDENGLYVINAKIVEELIKMPKVIVEIMEGTDLIRSKVKADAFFHFILTIEDNKAVFKLLEKIPYQSNKDFNAGAYSNINEYIIDEVEIPDKDFDRNALYQKYNISIENDGEVLSIFDMDELSIALYYNIVEKLKFDYLVKNAMLLKEKELETIEADYFESILQVLGEYEEFGAKVVGSVKKTLAEKHNFVIVSKPFFQKTVNEIMDNYLDLHIQDLLPEQKEEVLSKIRAVKERYYQQFKTILPIEIAQKAGIRFDGNQVIKEGIIGSLAHEIETKGFTSADIRKILINEDELQLSIAKIKEMVKENEEICKRDNTKANDITKGRNLTSKFYEELEKENKVDILTDKPLIKAAIEENVADKNQENSKKVEKAATATASAGGSSKGNTKGKTAGGGKSAGGAKKAGGGGKSASGGNGGKTPPKKQVSATKTNAPQQAATTKEDSKMQLFGTGTGHKAQNGENEDELMADLLEEVRSVARDVKHIMNKGTSIQLDVDELIR